MKTIDIFKSQLTLESKHILFRPETWMQDGGNLMKPRLLFLLLYVLFSQVLPGGFLGGGQAQEEKTPYLDALRVIYDKSKSREKVVSLPNSSYAEFG